MSEQEIKMMQDLTNDVRALLSSGKMSDARREIADSMAKAPDAAQPHNLMGILLERMNDHVDAMKHFRAAWALDPTFEPARVNIDRYGERRFGSVRPVFDETDCPKKETRKAGLCHIEYDAKGVGHVVRG